MTVTLRRIDEDMEDGGIASAEAEEEEPDVGGSLPEQQQEQVKHGASGRDAARTAQLDTKSEEASKKAAEKVATADGDAEMTEVCKC